MRRHWKYLRYVLRHKWYVFVAGLPAQVSWWRLVKHDWHKFLPSEWFPYARTFYGADGSPQYVDSPEFAYAWNLHQKRADHHWQHWLLTYDRGETIPLDMSEVAMNEMLADWFGAGRAMRGEWRAAEWYRENKEKIILSPASRKYIERELYAVQCELMSN